MSKAANTKLVGIFVVGAVALVIAGVSLFGSEKIFKKTVPMVFYFQGSVKGLHVGSPVVTGGVRIGTVSRIEAQFNPEDLSVRIAVLADTEPDKVVYIGPKRPSAIEGPAEIKKLINHGLRAQLQLQSIVTGELMINIHFIPETPIHLVGGDRDRVEIPTVPTTLETLTEQFEKFPVEKVLTQIANTIEGVNTMVNSPEARTAAKKLSQNMDELRALITNISNEVRPLSASAQETLRETRTLVRNADQTVQNVGRRIDPLASRAESTLDATQKLITDINVEMTPAISGVNKILEEARAAIAQARNSLDAVQGNYGERSVFYYQLAQALGGLNDASQSIQSLADYLERHPESAIWGKKGPTGK